MKKSASSYYLGDFFDVEDEETPKSKVIEVYYVILYQESLEANSNARTPVPAKVFPSPYCCG